jgi:hypothetical protein
MIRLDSRSALVCLLISLAFSIVTVHSVATAGPDDCTARCLQVI